MFNQITLLGYLGKDAVSSNKGGTIVTKFSVATKKSWKDQNDEWQEKSQWHQIVCFGPTYEAMTSRLIKGAQVFVQGQLSTHDYERTIKVPAGGKKVIDHVIKQLVVEIKVDTLRILDRSSNTDHDAAEPEPTEAP
jgi:single stranded DNA-binding protein